MRIGHTELFVRDPRISRDFYERMLGFAVTAVQHGGDLIWLTFGNREFMLRKGAPPAHSPDYQHSGQAFVLYTDDLAATMVDLQSRGLVFEGNDGPLCPTFRDPDGHWFRLVDPREA
jgi:catechol 2,3-dioxygenase-like lactoylglutathione lyase family enzyme